MRLLIVEDEPSLGQQLRNTLEGAGYAVDLATDGEDGHFLGSTENYDAVVLDLGLPTIDGLTVLDRWRKEGRSFPVLVLTARDSWSDKVAGTDRPPARSDPSRQRQRVERTDRRRRSPRHPLGQGDAEGRSGEADGAGI
jgi:two-component system, OmpR family, response regulator